MSPRTASLMAWSLWSLSVLLVALSTLLLTVNLSAASASHAYWLNLVVATLAFSMVGALIASRRPENPIGWLFSVSGLLYGVTVFANEYSTYTLVVDPGSLSGGAATAWLYLWLWLLSGSLVLFLFLLFPDGHLPSPRWTVAVWLVALSLCLAMVPYIFMPGPLVDFPTVENPFGIERIAGLLGLIERIANTLLAPSALVPAAALFVRFRHARGVERQQIKWVAYAVMVLGVAIVAANAWPALEGSVVGNVLFLIGFLAIPVAIGIAILRYRLYEIDVLINRTLVYGTLTIMLALVYLGSIVLLQGLFRAITGGTSQLAVIASTLAIAALFNPLRRRVQGFIDWRFYRRKYDAAKTREAFSVRLRDETDLNALSEHFMTVVRETMQPAHVSLWLRAPEEAASRKGALAQESTDE